MKLTGSTVRRAVLAAAAGLAVGALCVPALAQASTPAPMTAADAAAATALSAHLGATSAGSYLDSAGGRMVVTVTDQAAAATVRASGAVPRMVRRGSAQLAGVTATLAARATIPGTAWSVDPVTDQVVVSADSTVTATGLARLGAVAAGLGDAVRVEHTAGAFSLRIAGGDAIYAGQYRCSLGFNVHRGSTYYFLTAGHCGNIGTTWYADAAHTTVLGTTAGSSFPGNDYALIRYTARRRHPAASTCTAAARTSRRRRQRHVGESVRRSGSTTGVHSGTVTASTPRSTTPRARSPA